MKKIFVVFAVFAAMFLMISCGSGSKTVDTTDTGDTVNDSDTGDTGSTDTEPGGGDIEPTENPDSDDPDTAPDAGDSAPDNGDSTPDNDADSGDSQPDSDNEEPANENPDNLPECSPTSATPCIHSWTSLIWSGKSPEMISWTDAVEYCENLKEGGYSDWRLPSVAVLRTLYSSNLECSKFGEIVFFWSSSKGQGVSFYDGTAQSRNINEMFDARCVRKEIETRKADCTGLPEHAEWNTVSEITQTWDWETAGWSSPSLNGSYNEEPSTTECRFKCDETFSYWAQGVCNNPNDSYYVTNNFTPEDMVVSKEEREDVPQSVVDRTIQFAHNDNEEMCPDRCSYSRNPEYYDDEGNIYVVDNCDCTIPVSELSAVYWLLEGLFRRYKFTDVTGRWLPYRITYMNVFYSKYLNSVNGDFTDGSPTNIKIRFRNLVADVNFLSASCLSQATENASVITWSQENLGCMADGKYHGILFKSKNTAQVKDTTQNKNAQLCATMPNYQFDAENNTCYTTIEEFVWLENVPHKLLNKSGFSWASQEWPYGIKRIERHLDTNVFYMELTVGKSDNPMTIQAELKNAKGCIDQCYGKTGCTSHIEPSPDASKGCFINGEEAQE